MIQNYFWSNKELFWLFKFSLTIFKGSTNSFLEPLEIFKGSRKLKKKQMVLNHIFEPFLVIYLESFLVLSGTFEGSPDDNFRTKNNSFIS